MTAPTQKDLLEFPMARTCPFDPPPRLATEQETGGIRRVRIWNGDTPWLVTGFDLCRQVLGDARVSADTDTPGFPFANPGYRARRDVSKSFVNMDDPRHNEMRRSVTADFTAKRAEIMRSTIQDLVDGLIDKMLAGPRPTDLVRSFSLQVPSLVICEMLGVANEDRDMFFDLAATASSNQSTPQAAADAQRAMFGFLTELAERRASGPGDDLISRLVQGWVVTGRMTQDEAVAICNSILIGGFDTTSNMIALGTLALLEHPDVLAEIRSSDDPALIANATEELLRYLTILHMGRRRVALEDIEVAGQLVRQGEGLIIAHDAANRDPSAFPDPDTLDIHRSVRHHLAFGYGAHQCLGQSLSRVELQVVYGTLYRRIPTLALAVPFEELRFKSDSLIYGVHELPVTW